MKINLKNRIVTLTLAAALTVTGFAMPTVAYGAEEDGADNAAAVETQQAAEAAGEEAGTDDAVVVETPAETVTDEEAAPAEEIVVEEEAGETPAAPETIDIAPKDLKAVSVSYDSVKLTWTAVEGIDRYAVYVSKTQEVWDKYAEVEGTECLVKDMPTNRVRYFKIVSMQEEPEEQAQGLLSAAPAEEDEPFVNDESEVISAMAEMDPSSAKGKLASSKMTGTISWNRVPGAKGYYIYRYSGVSKKYERLKTVTGETTLSTQVEPYPGVNNYYKVYAFRMSEGSNVMNDPSNTVILDVRGEDRTSLNFKAAKTKASGSRTALTTAKLTWSKISGADSYGIFRYDGKQGKYVWVKGVSGTSANVTVPKGNNTYFKVYGYKKYNGKTLKTQASNTVRIDKIGKSERIIYTGKSKLGCPYVWAAAGPYAFDCSGFTMYVMRQQGIYLPHNAAGQYYALSSKNIGTNWRKAKPGDLVFYSYGGPGSSHHVGIYVGDGKVMHASSSHGRVVITNIGYSNGHVAAICRP